MKQKGFARIGILVVLAIFIVVAGGVVVWQERVASTPTPIPTTPQTTPPPTPSPTQAYQPPTTISTAPPTSTKAWTLYKYPQLHYTIKYPEVWVDPTERGGDPSSGFSLAEISHPEKPTNKDNWLMGDGYAHKAVISIATSKTSHISVDEYYNNQSQKFLGTIRDKKKIIINGQEAIQYTSRFESEYVATILIKNGFLYEVRYDYANLDEKEANWNVYMGMLNSLRIP